MTTVNMNGRLTYIDLAKTLDPKGEGIAPVINTLAESNVMLQDMPVMKCNMTMAHRVTRTVKLPEAFWRSINRGVPVSKGETAQFDETVGQLSVWAQVDRTLAEINGNKRDWMLSQESMFVESMNQEMQRTLIYGNTAENDAKFTGLAPRYSTLDTDKAETAKYIIDAGGRGANNTSAWLMLWGPRTVHAIVPDGLTVGLKREHEQNVTLQDDIGNEFKGHRSYYEWNLGIAVEDHRYIVRVANIDTAELTDMINNGAATAASQKLLRCMMQADKLIPNAHRGRPVWYVNRSVSLMLDCIAMEKGNVNLTTKTFEGGSPSTDGEGNKALVTTFRGVPVRTIDAIRDDELAVTA